MSTDVAFAGECLGHFVAQTGWDDLDDSIRREACRALINYFACALGACADPAITSAIAVLGEFSGPGGATVIGHARTTDAMSAAFINALGANLMDYDDTHLNTVIHPTAPVAAPTLALAEQRHLRGEDVLLAFALGAEVECRLGNAVSPGHYARGWHITATCGVFGSAAATGKLLGLSANEIWHALGIAASQSAGVVENLPSAAKNVGVGNAARNGLFAALLAREGYTAAPAAIEGPLGWARAAGDEPDLEALTGALGERWELARNTYKPYPCGIVLHSVIDACLALRERHRLDAASIESVTVCGDALLIARGDRAVRNERDARVSIHHCAAVALALGRAGPAEFARSCVDDERVAALRGRINARMTPSLPVGAAAVRLRTRSGDVLETSVTHARGSIGKPLSDAELNAKLLEMAVLGGSGCAGEPLTEAVWALARATDVAAIMAMARGRHRAA